MASPERPEFRIEREYDQRCAHAQAMYNMAIQDAERELELFLEHADRIRQGEMAEVRRATLSANEEA